MADDIKGEVVAHTIMPDVFSLALAKFSLNRLHGEYGSTLSHFDSLVPNSIMPLIKKIGGCIRSNASIVISNAFRNIGISSGKVLELVADPSEQKVEEVGEAIAAFDNDYFRGELLQEYGEAIISAATKPPGELTLEHKMYGYRMALPSQGIESFLKVQDPSIILGAMGISLERAMVLRKIAKTVDSFFTKAALAASEPEVQDAKGEIYEAALSYGSVGIPELQRFYSMYGGQRIELQVFYGGFDFLDYYMVNEHRFAGTEEFIAGDERVSLTAAQAVQLMQRRLGSLLSVRDNMMEIFKRYGAEALSDPNAIIASIYSVYQKAEDFLKEFLWEERHFQFRLEHIMGGTPIYPEVRLTNPVYFAQTRLIDGYWQGMADMIFNKEEWPAENQFPLY